jgi:hypothetical protein
MVRTDISKSTTRVFHINQNTYPKVIDILAKWRREGVNISDKICQFIEREEEALSKKEEEKINNNNG